MNQVNARLVYGSALRAMRKAGVNPAQAILSQSYLRLEQTISATKTQYQFGVLVNDGSARPTEQRLNLQDAFYTGGISMYISKTAATTDTNMQLDTFPNIRTYTTSSAALLNLYNGLLSLTVNNRVITPAFDLWKFYYVPQTQNVTGAPAAANANVYNEQNVNDFTYPVEPNWVLIGSKNNQLTINLPNSVGTVDANSYIVLILRGVLAQNVTVVS